MVHVGTRIGCVRPVVSSDLAYNVIECIVDINAGLGRGFDKNAVELTGEIFSLCDKQGGSATVSLITTSAIGRKNQSSVPCFDTCLSMSKSHLLPTMIIGK